MSRSKTLFFTICGRTQAIFFLLTVMLGCVAKRVKADIGVDVATSVATQALPYRRLSLVHDGFETWGSKEGVGIRCYHFRGTTEETLSVDVDASTGTLRRYSWSQLLTESMSRKLDLEQARMKAETFITTKAKVALNESFLLQTATFFNTGTGSGYKFRWIKVKEGVQLPVILSVSVTASEGEVVNFLLIEHDVSISSLVPKLSSPAALEKANPHINLQPGWQLLNAQLAVIPPKGKAFPEQTLAWKFHLNGIRSGEYTPRYGQVGYEATFNLDVDATTGEVISAIGQPIQPKKTIQLRPPIRQPAKYLVIDFWPVWSQETPSSILFKTDRLVAGQLPSEDHRGETLAWSDAGKLTAILTTPRDIFTFSSTPDGNRIAFWMMNEIYVLDKRQGAIGRLNDGKRAERSFPMWNPNGEWLAMSGDHAPGSDTNTGPNIFITKVAERLSAASMQNQRCVALFPGVDSYPLFSPAGEQIAFIHDDSTSPNASQVNQERRWSLYLAKTIPIPSTTGQPEAPQRIIGSLPLVERISWFADGKRILVSYAVDEENYGPVAELKHLPEVIDVESKTRRPLKLPVLRDPDLQSGKPLIVREPVVSPDGKKIAFRALRWSGNPKDSGAICIYTCNLDGSGLKRITPPTATPMVPYRYPQAGVTALNAWEKLQPKQNLGQPMNREQEWKDAMKATGVREAPKPTPQTAEKPKAETPNPKTPKSQAPTASVP